MYVNTQKHYFPIFWEGGKRKILNYFLFIISYYIFEILNPPRMPKVKLCPCIMLPTPSPCDPPPPLLIPSSIVTLKSLPSAPPSSFPPLVKKTCPPPQPFIRGQVGRKFFSLTQPKSYTKLIDGCSLIIVGFQKPLPHKLVNTKFIILDPFSGVWTSPQVFDVWWEEIDSGALPTDEMHTHQIALVKNSSEFFLTFSNRKSQLNSIVHQIQQDPATNSDKEAFPNVDSEDEREKKDPDFHPDELD